MRTGTRCTILVKLPVAFSGGSSENCEPEAGDTLDTMPLITRPSSASIPTSTVCADLDVAELRLLEVGVDVEVVERHQRHQPRSRLHVVADLDGLVADDTVEWRADAVNERSRSACPTR